LFTGVIEEEKETFYESMISLKLNFLFEVFEDTFDCIPIEGVLSLIWWEDLLGADLF
jgi:hypothetical protein